MAYIQSSLYNSGTQLDFAVSPDLGVVTGKEFAVILNESYGGSEFTVQRHTGKKTFSLNFSFISSTFKSNLQSFRDAVGGPYKSFTYNDGSTSYTVRMSESSLQFTEVAPDVFSSSLQMREVSPS